MTTTNKKQPLAHYLKLRYPVTIEEAPEAGFFVQIEDLPGCFAQGETVIEAMEMIEIARKMWLEVAYEEGKVIPSPRSEDEYSGKFNVRIPKSLHQKIDKQAKKEGVSLNQYVVYALSHAAGIAENRKPYKTK